MNASLIPAPPFYWGVGIENTWMAEHNEINRVPRRLLDVYLQMQHYTQWKEDLDRATDLGVKAIRYSVPWYKANPKPGVYDWEWIARPLDYMVNHLGIIPVIDLIHYGTPLWMDNGVLNHAYPQRIAEYAAAFARQFKGLVNHFTPHNEPQLSAFLCGLHHYWPPYLTGADGWLKVGVKVGRGMVSSSQALRSELPEVLLISADAYVAPLIPDLCREFDILLADEEEDAFTYLANTFPACLAYGKVAPGSLFGQLLQHAGMVEAEIDWFRQNAQPPTILGVNYYPDCFHRSPEPQEGLRRGGEELASRLARAHHFFDLPVYLTETSDGATDDEKAAWMATAVETIKGLKEAGVPVVGMNWWPLYETIQWDYRDTTQTVAESIRPGGWNNGLYKIEETTEGSLKRVRTGAIQAYHDLILENSFNEPF